MNPNRNFSDIMHNIHNECQMCIKGDRCAICPSRNKLSYHNYESIDKSTK